MITKGKNLDNQRSYTCYSLRLEGRNSLPWGRPKTARNSIKIRLALSKGIKRNGKMPREI